MRSTLGSWILRVGLGGMLLLTLSLFPLAMTVSSAKPPRPPTDVPDLLDINTSTADQLKAFPGIGDAYSEKIIKGRPYQRNAALVQKKILPRAAYEEITYKIVASKSEP